MLSPTDKVKEYEIIAPLGSGGMALLYLARRRGVGGFSRLVTLKLIHPKLVADETAIERFLNEARISAHVAHPNVVHVEEVGEYAGSYYIAMEYVHGASLAELLRRAKETRKRLRPTLCVWLVAQIAEALHAAHQTRADDGTRLDIVHRDVSPQNVLIGHTGHVKLIDFGIAKSQADAPGHRTGVHGVLGKLRYMAPEQLRLERADQRTDVYALGVMLWEMLAGRSLLRCRRLDDEEDWAVRENPPAPSRFSVHSTKALDEVVHRAIACNAAERFSSALEFRTALLRADPAALQLDAPMVASLMRTMFGEELDRRRASWPTEVAGELEVEPPRPVQMAELTADCVAAISGDDERSVGLGLSLGRFHSRCQDAARNVLPAWWFGAADVERALAVLSRPGYGALREPTQRSLKNVAARSFPTLRQWASFVPPAQWCQAWASMVGRVRQAPGRSVAIVCTACVGLGVLIGSSFGGSSDSGSDPEHVPQTAPDFSRRPDAHFLTDTRLPSAEDTAAARKEANRLAARHGAARALKSNKATAVHVRKTVRRSAHD